MNAREPQLEAQLRTLKLPGMADMLGEQPGWVLVANLPYSVASHCLGEATSRIVKLPLSGSDAQVPATIAAPAMFRPPFAGR